MTSAAALSAFPSPTTQAYQDGSGSTWTAPDNGIVGGYNGDNVVILRAMTAFTAIAWYNSIEILILVLLRFKRRVSLYFWSLIVTALAIIVYQAGAWTKMLQISQDEILTVTFLNIGWIFMVAGQSVVLYSRLHLITQSKRILNFVLWMIVVNTICQYVPTTALTYGANVQPHNPRYVQGYGAMERVQMTFFTVQELIISSIYLVESRRFLKTVMEERTRKLMYELLIVNVALIVLDVALLSVEYENLYEIELTLKGMVYSMKLKLELGVLNKLVTVLNNRRESFRVTGPDGELDMKQFASPQVHNGTLSSGRRTSSIARVASRKTQHDETDTVDFADLSNGGPLRGPTDEDVSGDYLTIPELIHRRSSKASSITEMYPGRIDANSLENV